VERGEDRQDMVDWRASKGFGWWFWWPEKGAVAEREITALGWRCWEGRVVWRVGGSVSIGWIWLVLLVGNNLFCKIGI